MLSSVAILFALLISGFTQEHNDVPDKISDFTLHNVVSGNNFSLSEVSDAKAVVVIFTSHYCPYAKLYNDRIASLINEYSEQNIRFVLINSNNPKKSAPDSRENMLKMVSQHNLGIPYLSDSDQKVADLFGVQKTPEVFLLQRVNNSFEIVYRGAIDDNPQVASDVKHSFLKEAIESSLKGYRPLQTSVHPTGCMIKR